MNASGTDATPQQPSGGPQNSPGAASPSARYGKRRSGTFTGKVLAIIFAAIAIAVVVYMVAMFRNVSAVDVEAVETGGEVLSDQALRTNVDITRDDTSKPAVCVVYALGYEKNEVGRREVVVPAGGEATERYSVTMPTHQRPYAAEIYGCSSVIPPHLDVPER